MPRSPNLPPDNAHALEEKVRKLEVALEDARETIIDLVPHQYSEVLQSYVECKSTEEFWRWREATAVKIADLVPESPATETSFSRRANCPLCQHGAMSFGGYTDGFKLPLGLVRHLTGYGNVHQCRVTQAAFELGHDFVERHYGEAERAAQRAANEEKERVTASRRLTDTLYKVHPFKPPELVDEGYRSWLGKNRDAEGLAWAELRAKSLGFLKHVEGNVLSLEMEKMDYVVYADIRSVKKITFNVFKLPVTKAKRIWEADFDLPDYYKHDIEGKFHARLNEALDRFHR